MTMKELSNRLWCAASSFWEDSKKNLTPYFAPVLQYASHPVIVSVKDKIFNTRIGLACMTILICWLICFGIAYPMYGTIDDPQMRFIIENTFITGVELDSHWVNPSYMNAYLTYGFLFLYDKLPNIDWYDLTWYFSLSVSVFTIALCLARNAKQISLIAKLVILFGLPCFASFAFIRLQFSTVAGLGIVSVVIVFLSYFTTSPNTKLSFIVKSLYIIVALAFASMVRFGLAFSVGGLAFLLVLPFLPWKKWAQIAVATTPVVIGVICMVLLFLGDEHARRNVPSWKEWGEYNELFVQITNDSIFGATQSALAFNTAQGRRNLVTNFNKLRNQGVQLNETEKYVWNEDYYALLLNAHHFGEPNIFAFENLKKVAESIGSEVAISKYSMPKFRIEHYDAHTFLIYIIPCLFLLLSFPSRKNAFYICYSILAVIAFISILNIVFRPLPIRLWYNFTFAMLMCQLSYIYQHQGEEKSNKATPIILTSFIQTLILICFIGSCISIFNTEFQVSNWRKGVYKQNLIVYQHLNPEYLYIVEMIPIYNSTRPFTKNIFHDLNIKTLPSSAYVQDPLLRELYEKHYGLTHADTFKNLLERSDIRVIHWHDEPFLYDFERLMRHRYDLEIGAILDMPNSLPFSENTPLFVYQYVILNEQEKLFRESNHNVGDFNMLASPAASQRISSIRQSLLNKYIEDYPGDDVVTSIEAALSCLDCYD